MAVNEVLIIGGGITGSVAAIALAQRGVKVCLVERRDVWDGAGHGITVHGNALRAFSQIGVADRIIAAGVPFDRIRVHQADGSLLADVPTPQTGGPSLPATLGTLRSDLQNVLVDEIRELGVDVRLGCSVEELHDEGERVRVVLSDGTTSEFDLVVGADGIHSDTRRLLGFDERPAPSGMGIWRFVTDRLEHMDSSAVFYGGPWYKAGYAPISKTQCYAYILIDPVIKDAERRDNSVLTNLLDGYHGDFDHLRKSIDASTFSNYQPIEWVLIDRPWSRGRVILIGDAAHACPPLIAQGAAMCAEDAVILADYATRDGNLDQLLSEYWNRRIPRVRTVVQNSLQMVDWELHPEQPGADAAALMGRSLALMTEPA
jgi:2-polyprenyl-6-methoxyphenol hydroxylase-like FAD-dependent oxidoreductase